MKKYRKYLFIVIVLIINVGFVLTYMSKHIVNIELIDIIDNNLDDVEPHFEIGTHIIPDFHETCLVAYGRRVKKIEYSPVYIFADDWDLLRSRLQSDKRTFDHTFFNIHPYYVEYDEDPNKIFVYKLPYEYLGISGSIYVMKDSK